MPTYTQDNRFIAISTPLGKDVLLLKGFVMKDELSRPFHIEADLRSENTAIDPMKLVGENVTIRVNIPGMTEPRHINGYISRFSQGESHGEGAANQYSAVIVPWLWFLTRSADCKIFQKQTIPQIVEKVFKDFGFADYELALSAKHYKEREYVVQYRETAFAFVSRLLEQEGIYYFFKHENGKHTLVLADSASAHPEGDKKLIKFRPRDRSSAGDDFIYEWQKDHRLQPGKTALVDYDFKAPGKGLYSEKADPRKHAHAEFEVFDYPGGYIEPDIGNAYVAVRNQEWACQHIVVTGKGDTRHLFAGLTFTLDEHPRDNADFLVTSVSCSAQGDEFDTGGGEDEPAFRVHFNCIPVGQPFRPARTTPKPRVQGPQTAVVVGTSSEEIYTDEHGRVKVKFFWDRYGKADENASCFIRVSQNWAGKSWGGMFIPRVGQEVIVDFLEGDPDQPIITGRVYNGENKPPYALPGMKTISGIKTDSSTGGGGFNELRFEDKKGEEQVFMHAEKNMDVRVKADYFQWVGNDRNVMVINDLKTSVDHDEHREIGNDFKHKITNDHHLNVGGKQAIKVTGSKSTTVDGAVIDDFKADHTHKVAAKLSIKADIIVLEAGTNITLKVGDSYIAIDSSSIDFKTATLKGTADSAIELKSSGTGKFESTGALDLKSSAALTAEATGAAALKGATVDVNSKAAVTIAGKPISIG